MKLISRNITHIHLILFLLFSFVYIVSIKSIAQGVFAFDYEWIVLALRDFYTLVILLTVVVYLVAFLKPFSDKVLAAYLIVTSLYSFFLLGPSFNKLILLSSFIYLIFAFYYFITWEVEISSALYNPKYSKFDLEKNSRFPFRGQVLDVKGSVVGEFLITNIDTKSAFVRIISKNVLEIKNIAQKDKVLRLNIEVEDVLFSEIVRVATYYDEGIGVDFLATGMKNNIGNLSENTVDWATLSEVLFQRGHFGLNS